MKLRAPTAAEAALASWRARAPTAEWTAEDIEQATSLWTAEIEAERSALSFADQCRCAYEDAIRGAAPFVPSRAELGAAAHLVVARTLRRPDAETFVRETFAHVGLMPVVVALLKEALPLRRRRNGGLWIEAPR